jgi:hypothetical protein
MSKVRDIEVEIPVTEVGGSGPTPPPGHLKPNTPRGSNVEELTSELKVLKLKKKLKSKKTKIQEVSSSSSSNDEGNGSSSSRVFEIRRAMAKRRMGLSLPTTLPLSIMIACPLTISSLPCTSASLPVSMG